MGYRIDWSGTLKASMLFFRVWSQRQRAPLQKPDTSLESRTHPEQLSFLALCFCSSYSLITETRVFLSPFGACVHPDLHDRFLSVGTTLT